MARATKKGKKGYCDFIGGYDINAQFYGVKESGVSLGTHTFVGVTENMWHKLCGVYFRKQHSSYSVSDLQCLLPSHGTKNCQHRQHQDPCAKLRMSDR